MKSIKRVHLIVISFSMFTLFSCTNSITIDDDCLKMKDINGTELFIEGENVKVFQKILLSNGLFPIEGDTWFVIEENYYSKYDLIPDSLVNPENLKVILFSKDSKGEQLYRDHSIDVIDSFISIKWHLAIKYDEEKDEIIEVIYQF